MSTVSISIRDTLTDLLQLAVDACNQVSADIAWPLRHCNETQRRNYDDFTDVVDGLQTGIRELRQMSDDLNKPSEQQAISGRLVALRSGVREEAWNTKDDPPQATAAMAIARQKVEAAIVLFRGIQPSG